MDRPQNKMIYWFEADDGSLRLCKQRVDARNNCGSTNVEFNLVEGSWQHRTYVAVCS
jgi:hypothetical protein